MPKCVGTTAKGNACKNEAVPESTFCGNHRPNSEVFAGLMPDPVEVEIEEEPMEVEDWEANAKSEKVFFDEVYEHFCDNLENTLSFDTFYELAERLKLVGEEPYDSDKHGDNYDAQEGELVIVKCK
jgi:hypothetical protein|tara:strand:+ start:437 stop:814 length:378 start_codon:yes stop_codon:yes gene_type:complete